MDMLRGPYLYPTVATHWADDIGFTGQTRRNYLGHLRRLHARVVAARPGARFNEITAEEVADYVDHRHDGAPRADRSRASVLGIVWQVYDWACDPEAGARCGTRPGPLVEGNPAARLRALARRDHRSPRNVIRKTWLTQDWARVLIATTRGDGASPIDQRDATMIALYLYTGMRVSELIRIRWRQVDFSAGQYGVLVQVLRKGGKLTDVPLTPAAQRELFAWRAKFVEAVGDDIADLGIVPQTVSLLVGPPAAGLAPCVNPYAAAAGKRRGEDRFDVCPTCGKRVRVTLAGTLWAHGTRPGEGAVDRELVILWRRRVTAAVSVRNRVALRAEAAGIPHLRPHDLRRSYAGILEDAMLAQPGGAVDLRAIQAGLGHEQMATTEKYLEQRTKLAPAALDIDLG
jgi:integrase